MTNKQAELMGIFAALPTGAIDTYYLDKFRNIFTTIGETIKYDELSTELVSLGIVPRGVALDRVKIGDFTRNSVTPDIIGGKSTLTTNDLLQLQPGQVETVINGNIINNAQAVKDRHLTKLKTAYFNTQTKMSAQLYLTGKLVLPESKDEIDFGYAEPTAKSVKKKDMDWTTFILELVDEYRKENDMYPTNIEVDSKIFKSMIQDESFRDQVKAFNSASLGTVTGRPVQPTINILGYQIVCLPSAKDITGEDISTENLIYLSNNAEFVKGYTGLTYTDGSGLKIFTGEYLIDEIIKKDPDSHSLSLQSGFVPIIPLAKRVKRYKLTLS